MSAERWIEGKRRDGLAVVEGVEGYVIIPHGARLPVDRCPCCDKGFPRNGMGFRAARLVADMLFPMTEETEERRAHAN